MRLHSTDSLDKQIIFIYEKLISLCKTLFFIQQTILSLIVLVASKLWRRQRIINFDFLVCFSLTYQKIFSSQFPYNKGRKYFLFNSDVPVSNINIFCLLRNRLWKETSFSLFFNIYRLISSSVLGIFFFVKRKG